MFYFEERMPPVGVWSPCTAPEPPTERTSCGTRRHIRAVREVPASVEHLTLAQLHEIISPDGRFKAIWK